MAGERDCGCVDYLTRNEKQNGMSEYSMGLWTLDQVNKGKVMTLSVKQEVVTCQTVGVVRPAAHWTQGAAKEPTAFIAGMACRCICIGIPSIVDEDDPANRYADTPEAVYSVGLHAGRLLEAMKMRIYHHIKTCKEAAEQLMTMEV